MLKDCKGKISKKVAEQMKDGGCVYTSQHVRHQSFEKILF